jgi:threonine/homoserine/homoserine lactone efflux protein
MPTASTLAVFAAATLAILVIPGPAVLYIVTRSVEQGRRTGLASVIGVHVGTSVHVLAAALGLSALLVSSAVAFSAVKYAGAAYLIFIGVRRLFFTDSTPEAATPEEAEQVALREPRADPRRAFRQGVVVNVLNPKTALFFLAFLPTFLDPRRGPLFVQVLVLGMTFITLGLISDGAYALTASYLATRWRGRSARRGAMQAQRWSGLVYIGLGVLAALTPRRATT